MSPSGSSIPQQTRYYPPPATTYRYQAPHWSRTEPTPVNYNTEPVSDYIQRGIYRPSRLTPIESKDEPHVLHYYTGYDHFATVDPSDIILTRRHPSYPGRASPVRKAINSSYYQQNDYLTSAM